MIRVFGLTKCSTCKKATAWLDQRGLEHEFIDYRDHPIEAKTLVDWAEELGWTRLVNRASMTWRNLTEEQKDPQDQNDWLALIDQYPALIRRPLVVTEEQIGNGFSKKKFSELFES